MPCVQSDERCLVFQIQENNPWSIWANRIVCSLSISVAIRPYLSDVAFLIVLISVVPTLSETSFCVIIAKNWKNCQGFVLPNLTFSAVYQRADFTCRHVGQKKHIHLSCQITTSCLQLTLYLASNWRQYLVFGELSSFGWSVFVEWCVEQPLWRHLPLLGRWLIGGSF